MIAYLLTWISICVLSITAEVNSEHSMNLPQVDERRHDAIKQPTSAARDAKMAYFDWKRSEEFDTVESNRRHLLKKQLAMVATHAGLSNSAYASSSTRSYRQEDSRSKEATSEMDEQTSMGWTNEAGSHSEQQPEIINERAAIISPQDIARQEANLIAPKPLLMTDSTTRVEGVLAPVAKPLPKIFAGPVSPDTGRTIPQFSGEEFRSAENCETVDEVIANGNDSILLQSLREAGGRLETSAKLLMNALAARIYNTILSNKSIDDYDKFVRLKIVLLEFIGLNEERAKSLLPLRLGKFGTLQQLLACP